MQSIGQVRIGTTRSIRVAVPELEVGSRSRAWIELARQARPEGQCRSAARTLCPRPQDRSADATLAVHEWQRDRSVAPKQDPHSMVRQIDGGEQQIILRDAQAARCDQGRPLSCGVRAPRDRIGVAARARGAATIAIAEGCGLERRA
ncbi:MAG: hypothetical protein KUG81_10395 [Gammaproteobacteria bacterium]|nr:hypothetical protein [Gammaproteobacteria bacterium]